MPNSGWGGGRLGQGVMITSAAFFVRRGGCTAVRNSSYLRCVTMAFCSPPPSRRFAGVENSVIFSEGFPWPSRSIGIPDSSSSRSSGISRVPCLMLYGRLKPWLCYLFDQIQLDHKSSSSISMNTVPKHSQKVYMPQMGEHHCIGSSHGFVFFLPKRGSTDIIAINPLTGDRLNLPPTSDLPEPPPGPYLELLPLAHLNSKYVSLYHAKATLFPSDDIAVLLRRDHNGFAHAFLACLSSSSSSSPTWLPFPLPIAQVDDCIFHKGHFIVVSRDLTLGTFKETGHPWKPQPIIRPHDTVFEPSSFRRYLVESPDGEDLFLVLRQEVIGATPLRTDHFVVLRLDEKDKLRWKPVDSLGGLAFFVGPGDSIAVPAADFPHLKPDSVYFVTDHGALMTYRTDYSWLHDNGVFDLQDGSIRFFEYSETTTSPIWVAAAAD